MAFSIWTASDFQLARELFSAKSQWSHRRVVFRKFLGYEKQGTGVEKFRTPKYASRAEHVFITSVKVFDTVKGGYFTTGDLDVNSPFQIRGYSPGFALPTGEVIEEYAGDQIIWNGKVWAVSDQVEPVQFGFLAGQVYWRTVLRHTGRSGQGIAVGP